MKRSIGLVFGFAGIAALLVFALPAFVFAQSAPPSCLSATAQDTLGSSLQQLTELANTLLVENLPQTVLSADENLVDAISQVVLQVTEACLPSESGLTPTTVGNPFPIVPTPPANVQTITSPTTVLITASIVNVRSLPNTSASLSGSQTLHAGNEFTAVGEVTGQSVNGNDLWYVSASGNYVWSGGAQVVAEVSDVSTLPVAAPLITAAQGYNPTTGIYETTPNTFTTGDTYLILYGTFTASGNIVLINGQALPASDLGYQSVAQINVSLASSYAEQSFTASVTDGGGTSQTVSVNGAGGSSGTTTPSLPSPATKTVSSGGTSYSVTYTYLADGEIRGTFTYKGNTYAVQGAGGVSQGDVALVKSNGTFTAPSTAVLSDLNFVGLTAEIPGNAPTAETVFPGFTFRTPLYSVIDVSPYYVSTPANAFVITQSPYSNIPVPGLNYLNTNANGTLISVTPITVSAAELVTEGTEIAVGESSAVSSEIYSELQTATDINTALSIANAAGLTVTGGPVGTSTNSDAAYLVTTSDGTFVAAAGYYDASTAVGAPVTSAYPPGSGGSSGDHSSSCVANIGTGTAHVMTWPDGKIYGLAGIPGYTLSTNCAPGDPVACSQTAAAAATAASAVAAAGGSAANGANYSTVSITWVNIPPGPDGRLADSLVEVLGNNTDVCSIRLYAASLGPVGQSDLPQLSDTVTHEIGHCMGLEHSSDPRSTMYAYAGANDGFSSDDEAVLSALKSGASIAVGSCSGTQTPSSCTISQTYDPQSQVCVDKYACTCDDAEPACTNTQTGQSVPLGVIPVPQLFEACSAISASNPPSSPICSCTSSGPLCVDSSYNIVAAPDKFCTTPIPPGETCTCFDGTASCADTSGNIVTPPSGFICPPLPPSPIIYGCNSDDECVVDPLGDYTDSTCDDACVGESGQ